jgi:hypothetical protein
MRCTVHVLVIDHVSLVRTIEVRARREDQISVSHTAQSMHREGLSVPKIVVSLLVIAINATFFMRFFALIQSRIDQEKSIAICTSKQH